MRIRKDLTTCDFCHKRPILMNGWINEWSGKIRIIFLCDEHSKLYKKLNWHEQKLILKGDSVL